MSKIYLAVVLCFCLAMTVPCINAQNLLIKNGTLLTVTQGTVTNGDILILDGIIKKIGKNIQVPENIKIIDVLNLPL